MHLEHYTADAICQAMGLPGFVEESWTQCDGPTLRLLLKPSFHPELCLTLFREKESTRLSVVALAERFWTQVAAAHGVRTPVEEEARRRAEEEVRRRYESEAARWITLTDEEKAARVRAFVSAMPDFTEMRRRYESEAARWITLTEKEKAARVRALKRAIQADTEARQRFESEDVRWIEEEAHKAGTRPKKAQRLLPSEREEVLLPSSAFDEVARLFSEARAAFGPRDIGLDGMGSESCLVSRAGVHRLDARVSGVAMVDYVGKVIALAWSSCCRPRVCKALAEAAGYIDMNADYALKEVGQQCSAARKRSRRIEAKALRELKRLRTRHS